MGGGNRGRRYGRASSSCVRVETLATTNATICCRSPACTGIWYRSSRRFCLDLLGFCLESGFSVALGPFSGSLKSFGSFSVSFCFESGSFGSSLLLCCCSFRGSLFVLCLPRCLFGCLGFLFSLQLLSDLLLDGRSCCSLTSLSFSIFF